MSERDKIAVWAKAAGRCTFCNRSLVGNEDLGDIVPIGELAHNVGWNTTSPRGLDLLSTSDRQLAANLLLLCGSCHKPIDESDAQVLYTVQRLSALKAEHEERIAVATAIRGDKTAAVLRLVGPVRGSNPSLSIDDAHDALLSEGLFPAYLPGRYRREYEFDFLKLPEPQSPAEFATQAHDIDRLFERVNDGIQRNEVGRLAVFAIARIPLLIHLGTKLDDKIPISVFQRTRTDSGNPWRWSPTPNPTPSFEPLQIERGGPRACLIINASGYIPAEAIPESARTDSSVWTLAPVSPATAGPTLIDSRAALASFESSFRNTLSIFEKEKVTEISLFAAAPVSACIQIGRSLMRNVHPVVNVYERDADGVLVVAARVAV